MKVYVNREPVSGPWGGGNKTVRKISEHLLKLGHEVVYSLNDNEIDIIFCFDPRPNSRNEWFQSFIDYRNRNPDTKIVQRIGDVGTHGKPDLTSLVKASVEYSDFLIFPSKWSMDYIGYKKNNFKVIRNRPEKIFHNHKRNRPIDDNIRIVTHHWSTNPKKGFNTYSSLPGLLSNEFNNISFTYIGRVPDSFKPIGVDIIPPSEGDFLSRELPLHDIYFTASVEEAGANHAVEAIAAGLPIIYSNLGGSIPEYCKNYGIGYSENKDIIKSFKDVINNFNLYKERAMLFNEDISETIDEYYKVLCEIR